MIIPMGELLRRAKKEGYGVAAPNVFNDKTIEAAFQVADELFWMEQAVTGLKKLDILPVFMKKNILM